MSDEPSVPAWADDGKFPPNLKSGDIPPNQVFIAFRVLGSRKHEHWLNEAACRITAKWNLERYLAKMMTYLGMSDKKEVRIFCVDKKTGL